MSLLSPVGVLSYAAYTFNGSTKTSIRSRMVYDGASRVVAYVVYTLRARTVIQNASGTDSDMLDLRDRLFKPGQALIVTGHGFGDFQINVSEGGAKDVIYGPKPTACDFEPLGIPNAWAVDWTCEVAIPQCSSSAKYKHAALAFNYEIDYSIGDDGLTTRTYSGYLEIPATRLAGGSSRQVQDTVDFYREGIVPLLIPGFRRSSDFRMMADKRTLRFTITDIQTPGDGLPIFCTAATGRHVVQSETENTFNYRGTITASYTVAQGAPKTRAWEAFALLVEDRFGIAKKYAGSVDKSALLTGCRVEEGLYEGGREVTFEMNYFFASSIQDVMVASGMWRPVPGTDWRLWASSLAAAQGPRGLAGLFHDASEDVLIDLCASRNERVPLPNNIPRTLRGTAPRSRELRSVPTPDNSWLKYESHLEMLTHPGTSILKTLPEPVGSSTKNPLPTSLKTSGPLADTQTPPDDYSVLDDGQRRTPAAWALRAALVEATQKIRDRQKAEGSRARPVEIKNPHVDAARKDPDILMERTTASYGCRLYGFGIRAGYYVPCPQLKEVAGAPVVPHGPHKFDHWTSANWNGIPITTAVWDLHYRFLKPPRGQIGVPANPAMGVDG